MRYVALAAFCLFVSFTAHAQQAVLQGGTFTRGHAPMYAGQGSSQPVVQDSGPAGGGAAGLGLSELLQVNRGTGTAPYANTGTGPLSTHSCSYDGPVTGANHFLCWDANAQGGGVIAYGAQNGASDLDLNFNINGTVYTIGDIAPITQIPNNTVLGNASGSTAAPSALTKLPTGFQLATVGSTSVTGAVCNGTTDDTAAFAAAMTTAVAGGVVVMPRGQCAIKTGNLAVPTGVTLTCATQWAGGQKSSSAWDYPSRPCTIILNPTYTISVASAAGIDGITVINQNTVTAPTNTQTALTMVSTFSGTGVTIAGGDSFVRNSLILGFGTCVSSSGFQRAVLDWVQGDCTNGVLINASHDEAKLSHVEFWPFMTANQTGSEVNYAVSGAADSGAGLYRLTVPSNVIQTGNTVWVAAVGGATGARGKWTATVVDATHIDLDESDTTPSTTGNTTSGSSVVKGLASVANIAIGQTITGTGIQGGTTVTDVWPVENQIYISQTATATNVGTALSFTNAAFTSGGVVYIDTNQRTGTGFTITDAEGTKCIDCFAYGYHVGYHVGTNAGFTNLVNADVDNNGTMADPTSIGMLIDGTAYEVTWSASFASSYGTALYISTSAANTGAHGISNITLNGGSAAGPYATVVTNMLNGHAVITGTRNPSGGKLWIGDGTDSLILSADSMPNTQVQGNPSGITNTVGATTNIFKSDSVDLPQTIDGDLTITGELVVQGTGPSTIGGDFGVAGDSTIFGSLGVNGELTVEGDASFQGNAIRLNSSHPDYQWRGTTQGSEQKNWSIFESTPSGNLSLRAVNDAYTLSTDALIFVRNGNYTAPTITMPVALTVQSQIISSVTTGTAPFVISSTTNVANLNASSLSGATFAAPGAIGGGTPGSGAFTTLTASSGVTLSGVTTGTNAFTVCMTAGKLLTLEAAPCTISSRRFKHDITPLTDNEALPKIMAMRPVAFNMNNPEHADNVNITNRQIGLIAEDVEAIDKRLAVYEQDGVTPKSYRPESVTALLVKALQELANDNADLRREVDTLKRAAR